MRGLLREDGLDAMIVKLLTVLDALDLLHLEGQGSHVMLQAGLALLHPHLHQTSYGEFYLVDLFLWV